jgi:uncharacterized protein (DUF736 family)
MMGSGENNKKPMMALDSGNQSKIKNMKKTTILLLSLILLATFTDAQDKTDKKPCFRVSSFSSSLGFGGAMTSNTSEDYYLLKDAVDNPGLFIDITGYKENGNSYGFGGMSPYSGMYYSGGGGGNGSLLFNLGLTPYSKKQGRYRENRELRFSLGGSIGSRNYFFYTDNTFFTIDTFQSVTNNEIVYADSAITKYYSYTLNFTEINLGASYLFKTDVSRRVHFYTGFGVNYGITLRSSVDVTEDIWRSVIYYNENDTPDDDEPVYFYDDNASSVYSTSTTNLTGPMHFFRAYIPLGFSLNLSKKPESFFSHVDLYTELNPGVEFQVLSSEKTYANPYIGVGFIGFRYKW